MNSESDQSHLLEVDGILRQKWRIIRKLGRGGFGEIYEAVDILTVEKLAIKVESGRQPKQVLKMELAVLKKLQSKDHVCQLHGSGRTNCVNFIVMTLLGKNLGELRRNQPRCVFSISTGIRLVFQILEAIEAIHSVGFLHRDIKPSNFAIGAGPQNHKTVYMIDFGLARQYIDLDNNIRSPRPEAGFRGTIRYASLTAHLNREMSRTDDLWSVFYVLVEFITAQLPWRKIKDKEEVGRMKQNFNHDAFLTNLPMEFKAFMRHIQSLGYYDKPDYDLLRNTISRCKQRKQISYSDPFDWEDNCRVSNQDLVPRPEVPCRPASKEVQGFNSAVLSSDVKLESNLPGLKLRQCSSEKEPQVLNSVEVDDPLASNSKMMSYHPVHQELAASLSQAKVTSNNREPLARKTGDNLDGCATSKEVKNNHRTSETSGRPSLLISPLQNIDELLNKAIIDARDELLGQIIAKPEFCPIVPPKAKIRPSKVKLLPAPNTPSLSSSLLTPPDCPNIDLVLDSPYALQVAESEVSESTVQSGKNPVLVIPGTERGEMPIPKPRSTIRPITKRLAQLPR